VIDPERLREQRKANPKPCGCFCCGKRLGAGNWYGLCLRCVARTPKEQRAEFHQRHMARTGRGH
jgi:hypothetical protein